MRFFRSFAAAAVLATGLAAAHAQDGPVGIAIVEAPEQSSGICAADNLDTAMDCARRKCAEAGDGTRPGDCLRVRWCYPAGWSADIFMQNRDGFHWHDYLCGWSSRALLMKAVALKCETGTEGYLLDCALVRVWDKDGNEVSVDE